MVKIVSNKYSASFTSGSLLLHEFSSVTDILISGDLKNQKMNIISGNLLQINSESSRKRVYTEIFKRVNAVPSNIWSLFNESDENGKKILLFYVCLKTYKMIFDFQVEVVLEKYRSRDLSLNTDDIEMFLVKKCAEHPEIDNWSATTREKAKSTIILILKQTNMLKNGMITPPNLPILFWRSFMELGESWFLELALLNKFEREQILGNTDDAC